VVSFHRVSCQLLFLLSKIWILKGIAVFVIPKNPKKTI
jgi:hypothetical protein